MKKFKITNQEIRQIISGETQEYPKYATQLLNLANQNSQGTRPKVVGQMTELITQFEGNSLEEWENWYIGKHPTAISDATDKVWQMIQYLQTSILKVDKALVKMWVEDLVIVKTYTGLKFQQAILNKIGNLKGCGSQSSTPAEESQGIDGYIGDTPVSIKPSTYVHKKSLNESIEVEMIYYDKGKTGITVYCNL